MTRKSPLHIPALAGLLLYLVSPARMFAQDAVWTRYMGAEDAYNFGRVAVDPGGNVYLCGTAKTMEGRKVGESAALWFVTKTDPEGKKLWTRILADTLFPESRWRLLRRSVSGYGNRNKDAGKHAGAPTLHGEI